MVLGWRYAVGAGWKRPASTTVDTLFAQRRPLTDRLGMDVRRAGRKHDRPAVAQSYLLHLHWHRYLGNDRWTLLDEHRRKPRPQGRPTCR